MSESPTPESFSYPGYYAFGGLSLPYVPLIGAGTGPGVELTRGEVRFAQKDVDYVAPPAVAAAEAGPVRDEVKARLMDVDIPVGAPVRLAMTFGRAGYRDYAASGQQLDVPQAALAGRTFRDVFGRPRDPGAFASWGLTNICGAGLLIETAENRLLIARQSSRVLVNPGRQSYTAAGTLDWADVVDPFVDAAREAREEIAYTVDPADLVLTGFGLDTRKLYWQFSFLHRSRHSGETIRAAARSAPDFAEEIDDLTEIECDPDAVARALSVGVWEPSTAASVIQWARARLGDDTLLAAFAAKPWPMEPVGV